MAVRLKLKSSLIIKFDPLGLHVRSHDFDNFIARKRNRVIRRVIHRMLLVLSLRAATGSDGIRLCKNAVLFLPREARHVGVELFGSFAIRFANVVFAKPAVVGKLDAVVPNLCAFVLALGYLAALRSLEHVCHHPLPLFRMNSGNSLAGLPAPNCF